MVNNMTLKEIKTYYTKGDPERDDINEALLIAYMNNCYIKIEYHMFGWPYSIMLSPEDSIDDIWEILEKRKPYGM